MVIDADATTQKQMCGVLRTNGYNAITAMHGVEAVHRMNAEIPDLIVIDERVRMGGLETAKVLRGNQRFQRIPILLTASGKTPTQVKETVRQVREIGVSWSIRSWYTWA